MTQQTELYVDTTQRDIDNHIAWLDEKLSQAETDEERSHYAAAIESLDYQLQRFHEFSRSGHEHDHPGDVGVRTGCIQVSPSGTQFFFQTTTTEQLRAQIQIRDMAHHLARQRRFNGGSDGSVAQHL